MWELKIFNIDNDNIFEDIDGVNVVDDDIAEAICLAFEKYDLLKSARNNEYDFDEIYETDELFDFACSNGMSGELVKAIEDVVDNPSQYADPAFTLAYYED